MNTWTTSPELAGYKTKVVQYGPCTIIINRPETVTTRQTEQIKNGLEGALRDYYRRTHK